MKAIVICMIIFAFCLKGSSQTTLTNNCKFASIVQGGLISGSSGESSLVEWINGVKKDKWFAGAGAALNFYHQRDIPVFIDVRRDILNAKKTPFAYADAGMNFEWLNFIQKEERSFPKATAGLYYDVGIGYKVGNKNRNGFVVSIGYSFKQAKEKTTTQVYNPSTLMFEPSNQYMNYKYRMMVFKIGFEL